MEEANESDDEEEKIEEEPVVQLVKPSSVPENIIELQHSLGYDSKRLFNLCLVDSDTLLYASGNLLHYYSISRKNITLRRTVFGGGVGFIIKNHIPEFDYLTIAENGLKPTVFIYRYPEHEVVSTLKGGAVRSFTTGVYSNNGELMATQAGYPDFMLTIWNWQTSWVILRSRAYQNDVLNVVFSLYNPILLASCGLSHVQFWKMAETFTGLKLKSDLGRFGKTDTCDVYAVFMLADEKVISGCEWGNMLVWESGLIKMEVCRKARKPCHLRPITRFIWMGNNELMTVGMDGYARIWFWETVELADPPDEDRFVEIDPLYEFRIGDRDESCECRHLIKANPKEERNFEYYTQDGKGGVWICDLNVEATAKPAKKLFSMHGGRIVAGQASPVSPHMATLGEDGKVNIYNYEKEELLLQEPFSAAGADLLWFDTSIDPSGMVMMLGFADGVLRQVVVHINEDQSPKAEIHLLFALKPHATPITFLSVAPCRNILVSGSMDNSAFLYHIKAGDSGFVEIIPLGFLRFDGSPTCIHWLKDEERTALFGCHRGEVYECELPVPESVDLVKVRPTWCIDPVSSKMVRFISCKSQIRRDLEEAVTRRRKARKLARKKKEIKKLLEVNPGLEIDDSALADSSEEDEEAKNRPLFIPDPPCPVLWLRYTKDDTIWVSMGGYDAGYIYELKFGYNTPVRCTLIPEADDVEIHSYLCIGKFLIFGMQTGQIRIHAVKDDFRELNDFWTISMHDNLNGTIPRMFTSHDGKWFFSVGHDGSIFSYHWKGTCVELVCDPPQPYNVPSKPAKDIEDPHHLSLEEVKVQENLVKLRAFEEAERRRLQPSFQVMQLQVDWVVDKIRREYQNRLDAVLRKLESDVTGACHDAQDLYDFMFSALEYIPFEVYAVNKDEVVRAFRVLKLREEESESEFIEEEEIQEEEQDVELETIPTESATTMAGTSVRRARQSSILIFDFAEKVLLKLYIRILEFFSFLKQIKNDELDLVLEACGDMFEEDEEMSLHSEEDQYEEAEEEELGEEELPLIERAINFLNNSIRENVEVKNLEISIIQEILHTVMSEYNNNVIGLRQRKARLYEKYKKLQDDLVVLEEEISLPKLREYVVYHECPEEIFKEPFIPLRSFESILWEKPMKVKAQQTAAEEEADAEEERESEVDIVDEVEVEGEGGTLLEEEPSEEWLVGMENLSEMIEERIRALDQDITTAAVIRPRYSHEVKYLSYLLEISEQELVILQDSELTERSLVEHDEVARQKRGDITTNINRITTDIEMTTANFAECNAEIKMISAEFYEAVKGNKFLKFLRRIYEKKFKPAKKRDPDDESETESSSEESTSEDENEAGSGESGDMTAIQLDESHCPLGCDRKLYDLSFELRSARHALEQKIHDGGELNSIRRAEIEELKAKIPAADEFCTKERNNLLIFRHQKDEKLRAVETAIIYTIEGFGVKIEEQEERTEAYMQYLKNLLNLKKAQAQQVKEELQRPTESYMEKLRVLLEILEERERLRRLRPPPELPPPSPSTISAVSIPKPPTPPPPFDFEAYAEEKILKLVQSFFVRYLSKYISETYMRRYIPRVARVLGNIGRNFTAELADNIIGVIVENLERIVPKKYLVHATVDDIRALFRDIVAVFEMEPVEIDPAKEIRNAVESCIKSFGKLKVANRTQRIVFEVTKILVHQLPMDDFRDPESARATAKLLARESVIIPNCLNVEALVEQAHQYAKANMLSAITLKILRAYADELSKELVVRKAAEIRSVHPREKVCRDVRRKKYRS